MATEVGFEQSGDVGRKLPIAILRHESVVASTVVATNGSILKQSTALELELGTGERLRIGPGVDKAASSAIRNGVWWRSAVGRMPGAISTTHWKATART